MVVRVAINGLGRIGRNFLRGALKAKGLQVVAVNDLGDPHMLAHLFQYDSVFGRFPGKVEVRQGILIINGHEISVICERNPAKLPWSKLGIDVVIESTGVFREREKAALHLQAGAKKVIISAPGKNEDITLVLGVNHDSYDPSSHHIISNASCTTNCLAPIIKVLLDNYGIRRGAMATIHAYTNDQRLLDLLHRDPRRARAAAINTIPTSTGAAKAITRIFPQLEGKLTAIAYRVPVPNVSLIDLNVELETPTTAEKLNATFHHAAATDLKGILSVTDDLLVSSDFIGDPHSAILDSQLTSVIDGTLAHLVAWYDNEYGYSARLVELAQLVGSKL